ncbi:hypothetical protein L596_024754 [Steinernema carpocapsae]|uniref:Uncharacterized protein n=1 Tax=Steinernema carpocapsae TaxID=34508 RepID=A0A4U5M6K3_STECR|nr:hypothetical protein L596_024754 [Steinernema carpocapsae]
MSRRLLDIQKVEIVSRQKGYSASEAQKIAEDAVARAEERMIQRTVKKHSEEKADAQRRQTSKPKSQKRRKNSTKRPSISTTK